MNVFYTFDNNFLPQSATSICSLCENNKQVKELNIFIAAYQLTEENKLKLKQLVSSYNRNLTIIDIKDLQLYFDFPFDSSGWPVVTLARLLVGKLLPDNIERVLYLDADVIVRHDLSKLWNCDMGDKILGMSIEPTIDKKRKDILELNEYPYYNAGVMLINLKEWRNLDAMSRIFEFFKKHDGKLFAADQDAINGALKDDIYTLLPSYNYYNIYCQYPYRFIKRLMGNIAYFSKNQYMEAINDPYIVHFLGEERPWREGNTHKYRGEYKKYLYKTVWKDTKDEEGWKMYFFCWRSFNFLTRLFPKLRYMIISFLIPKFIRFRTNQRKKKEQNK